MHKSWLSAFLPKLLIFVGLIFFGCTSQTKQINEVFISGPLDFQGGNYSEGKAEITFKGFVQGFESAYEGGSLNHTASFARCSFDWDAPVDERVAELRSCSKKAEECSVLSVRAEDGDITYEVECKGIGAEGIGNYLMIKGIAIYSFKTEEQAEEAFLKYSSCSKQGKELLCSYTVEMVFR